MPNDPQAARPEPAGPGLVFFHGGDLDIHDALWRSLAPGSGCRDLSVAYRLAPEHPVPAVVEDAVAAGLGAALRDASAATAPDRRDGAVAL